ncbi:thiamine pyrophosphate-binding protein [Actinomadura madurae]|nr:thiamine pyrophosphate-binding protein [Actinomadura madurae]MCQ0019019.1 thiamine pyrophosphate-binding protein [Actinomadura madurae]
MHVGERLAALLVNAGVRRVFGVPGGQTTPLYHGIAGQHGVISHTLMRDERSAAFAADAYARMSGRVGVCDATVGPGVSNLVSGLLEAYTSSVPMLAIIADIPRHWETRRRFGSASQGFEQRSYLEPCVKYYGRVELPENLDGLLAAALRIATSGRPGPVVLEIPDDVFSADYPEPPHGSSAVTPLSTVYPQSRTSPDPAAVEGAVELLRHSRKPLLLAGGGALSAGAGRRGPAAGRAPGSARGHDAERQGRALRTPSAGRRPRGDLRAAAGERAAGRGRLRGVHRDQGRPGRHFELDAAAAGDPDRPPRPGRDGDRPELPAEPRAGVRRQARRRALADALPERGPGDWELERVRRAGRGVVAGNPRRRRGRARRRQAAGGDADPQRGHGPGRRPGHRRQPVLRLGRRALARPPGRPCLRGPARPGRARLGPAGRRSAARWRSGTPAPPRGCTASPGTAGGPTPSRSWRRSPDCASRSWRRC